MYGTTTGGSSAPSQELRRKVVDLACVLTFLPSSIAHDPSRTTSKPSCEFEILMACALRSDNFGRFGASLLLHNRTARLVVVGYLLCLHVLVWFSIHRLQTCIVARSDLSLELLEDDDAGDLVAISDGLGGAATGGIAGQQQPPSHSATLDDPDERFGR